MTTEGDSTHDSEAAHGGELGIVGGALVGLFVFFWIQVAQLRNPPPDLSFSPIKNWQLASLCIVTGAYAGHWAKASADWEWTRARPRLRGAAIMGLSLPAAVALLSAPIGLSAWLAVAAIPVGAGLGYLFTDKSPSEPSAQALGPTGGTGAAGAERKKVCDIGGQE